MKKALILLLVLVLALSAAAYGGSTAPTDSASSQNDTSKTDSAASNDNQDSEAGTATQNTENFVSTVESVLNTSDYNKEVSKKDAGQKVSYQTKTEIGTLDFKVTVDGFSFSLPVKYSDLISAGWTDTKDLAEETINKDSIASTTFTTSEGKSVGFSFITQGEESAKVKDTEAVQMTIKNATTDKAATIDPPAFTILGSVSNKTDLKGILQAATPSNVSIVDYNESGIAVMSTIKYVNGDDSIEIEYYVDDNTIETITMKYGIANTIVTY